MSRFRNTAKVQAAEIVRRGAWSALDCNDTDPSNLASHVGYAFDAWVGEDIRDGVDSMERDEYRAQVRQLVETLFRW